MDAWFDDERNVAAVSSIITLNSRPLFHWYLRIGLQHIICYIAICHTTPVSVGLYCRQDTVSKCVWTLFLLVYLWLSVLNFSHRRHRCHREQLSLMSSNILLLLLGDSTPRLPTGIILNGLRWNKRIKMTTTTRNGNHNWFQCLVSFKYFECIMSFMVPCRIDAFNWSCHIQMTANNN